LSKKAYIEGSLWLPYSNTLEVVLAVLFLGSAPTMTVPARKPGKPIQPLNGRMQPWENKGRLEFSLHAYTHTHTQTCIRPSPVSIRKGL